MKMVAIIFRNYSEKNDIVTVTNGLFFRKIGSTAKIPKTQNTESKK